MACFLRKIFRERFHTPSGGAIRNPGSHADLWKSLANAKECVLRSFECQDYPPNFDFVEPARGADFFKVSFLIISEIFCSIFSMADNSLKISRNTRRKPVRVIALILSSMPSNLAISAVELGYTATKPMPPQITNHAANFSNVCPVLRLTNSLTP